ncbi:hypothetical protein [Nocardia wallacei]|uniref:hypothetical protein n=1 Tax=Nocardia wallacei TaxID=480035 RepID=UPI0024588663|nr:hypothetical protein [Nocardia wallacei]
MNAHHAAPNRRRGLLVLAAISSSAVLLAAAVLAFTRDDHDTAIPAATSTAAPPTIATTPSGPMLPPTVDLFGNWLDIPADPAGQPLPQDPAARPDPGRPDYLTAPPAGLAWQRGWDGAAIPVSRSDGPAQIIAGIATGFAHTPQGAALAALDAIARASAAPEGIWQTVVGQRFLGGGHTLLDRFARSHRTTPHAGRYLTVPDGVRVLPGYQPDFAVVQIAVRARDGWTYSTWPMAYTDGDWRIRVPDDPETLWQPGTSIATLTYFGTWRTTP